MNAGPPPSPYTQTHTHTLHSNLLLTLRPNGFCQNQVVLLSPPPLSSGTFWSPRVRLFCHEGQHKATWRCCGDLSQLESLGIEPYVPHDSWDDPSALFTAVAWTSSTSQVAWPGLCLERSDWASHTRFIHAPVSVCAIWLLSQFDRKTHK